MKIPFVKKQGQTKIAVAMSGGVDSSVCAAILAGQGCEVIGITAILTDHGVVAGASAKTVCDMLGLKHHAVDLRLDFERLILSGFESEYLSGRTPSPCVLCNSIIKFGMLLEKAVEFGAERLATGHYARVREDKYGRYHLLRGEDPIKDQSYFLHRLDGGQLSRVLFPLGDMTKKEVRTYARSKNLPLAGSRDSQELCFISSGTHGAWIDSRSRDVGEPGDIVNMDGEIIGRHRGIHHYTVGQRRGLGVACGRPVYVVRIDHESNKVILGDRAGAMTSRMKVCSINWLKDFCDREKISLLTQIRYNHKASESFVRKVGNNSAEVEFICPQFAVTPGQAAVFYDGDEVAGGGWIE